MQGFPISLEIFLKTKDNIYKNDLSAVPYVFHFPIDNKGYTVVYDFWITFTPLKNLFSKSKKNNVLLLLSEFKIHDQMFLKWLSIRVKSSINVLTINKLSICIFI